MAVASVETSPKLPRSFYQAFKETFIFRNAERNSSEDAAAGTIMEKAQIQNGDDREVSSSAPQESVAEKTQKSVKPEEGEEKKKKGKKVEEDGDEEEESAKPEEGSDEKKSKKGREGTEEGEEKPKKPKNKLGKKKEIVSSSTAVPRFEVCIGKKCKAKGSEDLLAAFQTSSNGRVEIAYTKCMKNCKVGMNARATKDGTTFSWHNEVQMENVDSILCKEFDW